MKFFPQVSLALVVVTALAAQDHKTWSDYGGAADSAQYSALSQVNRDNVRGLQVAWTYPTGDENKYVFNPLIVDGRIYVMAKNNSIVALDAATGREIWSHPAETGTTIITNRGINYWESKDRSDRRLLYASNHFLRAIDARTGTPITTFGNGGAVNLKEGLDRDPAVIRLVQSTSPGRVFEDLLISMCARARLSGRFTRFPAQENLDTIRGPKTPGSEWAGQTSGASLRSIRSEEFFTRLPPARSITSTAPIAMGQTFLATPFWH
jgi:glucose dehydrogenase